MELLNPHVLCYNNYLIQTWEKGWDFMRISELLARDKITVSCEIFPPKKDGAFGRIFEVVDQINQLNVDFISVTYGAGAGPGSFDLL